MESESYGVFGNTSSIIGAYRAKYKRQIKRKHLINIEKVFSNTIIHLLD